MASDAARPSTVAVRGGRRRRATPAGLPRRASSIGRSSSSPRRRRELAAWLATLPFEAFQFRGYEGKRRVVSFGWQYDFTRSHLVKADDMPAELLPVRARAAAFAGLAPEDLQQCLLNEYLPGAPIGWHRDRPMFEKVVGISLLAPCTFRLRRRVGEGFERTAARARAALDLPHDRRGAHRLGALDPAGEGPPLLDHLPQLPRRGAGRLPTRH